MRWLVRAMFAVAGVFALFWALNQAPAKSRPRPAVKLQYLPWAPGRTVTVQASSPTRWVFGLGPGESALSGVPGLVTVARADTVAIELVDGTCARFGGLAAVAVRPGDPVTVGARLGTVGRSGLRYEREDCEHHRPLPSGFVEGAIPPAGRQVTAGMPRIVGPAATVVDTRHLFFDPAISADRRRSILIAIADLRPEAVRLVNAIPAPITFTLFDDPRWLGYNRAAAYGRKIDLHDTLWTTRAADRNAIVAHELGHSIEGFLVPIGVRDAMVARLPRVGVCPRPGTGDCTPVPEKFADTFARWAERGRFPPNQGYSVAAPPSLDDWARPLLHL